MPALTPDDRAKLLAVDTANRANRAAAKLKAGQPLTREERKLLAGDPAPTSPAETYVGTWDDLAAALGEAIGGTVTRRAIQDWRNDPRYRPEIEKRWPQLERADGRKCVAEWLRLMADLNLKRGAASADEEIDPENAGDEEGEGSIIRPPRVGGRQSEWTIAIAALDHRRKENAVRVQEGALLVAADLELPLGATFATIQTKLAQFPARTARYFVGLRDVAEIEERLRDEIDADLADLHAARFTAEDAVAAAVASVPFDAESEALLKVVTFDGQDRAALLQLVTAIATEALRRLGRSAITSPQSPREDAPPASDATHPASPPVAPEEPAAVPPQTPQPVVAKSDRAKPRKAKAASPAKLKKPRPKIAPAPAEVEAAIAPAVRRPVTRRRRG